MKRFALALAIVAMASACKKADDTNQMAADSAMADTMKTMSDSMKAMSDSLHTMGDTTKH